MEPSKKSWESMQDSLLSVMQTNLETMQRVNAMLRNVEKEQEAKRWRCDGCHDLVASEEARMMPAQENCFLNLCPPCFDEAFKWVRGEIEYEKLMVGEKKEQDSGPDAKAE